VLPKKNPEIASNIQFMRYRPLQLTVAVSASVLLFALTIIQVVKDVSTQADAWYFHAFYTYLVVLGVGSLIYAYRVAKMRAQGIDLKSRFAKLPDQ